AFHEEVALDRRRVPCSGTAGDARAREVRTAVARRAHHIAERVGHGLDAREVRDGLGVFRQDRGAEAVVGGRLGRGLRGQIELTTDHGRSEPLESHQVLDRVLSQRLVGLGRERGQDFRAVHLAQRLVGPTGRWCFGDCGRVLPWCRLAHATPLRPLTVKFVRLRAARVASRAKSRSPNAARFRSNSRSFAFQRYSISWSFRSWVYSHTARRNSWTIRASGSRSNW